MPRIDEALSKNLNRILTQKGISQSELARKINVTPNTVNRLVNQKAGVSWDTLGKIADALKVEETDLVGVVDDMRELRDAVTAPTTKF